MTEVQVVGEGMLTTDEKGRLDELCGVIDRGIKTFFEVGMALWEIMDNRLFRETHPTFEDFCRERWDMSKGYAYQNIAATQVVKNLSAMADKQSCDTLIIPSNERQARPLTIFDMDRQRDVWNIVLERAETSKSKITASLVSSVVAEYLRKDVKDQLEDRKRRISRETLIAPKFKDAIQSFVDVVSETINNGFKETSKSAVLRHIDAVRELVAHTKE